MSPRLLRQLRQAPSSARLPSAPPLRRPRRLLLLLPIVLADHLLTEQEDAVAAPRHLRRLATAKSMTPSVFQPALRIPPSIGSPGKLHSRSYLHTLFALSLFTSASSAAQS